MIVTTDSSGESSGRVVAHLTSNGKSYVAANHWPRAWYHRALENPAVEATINDETADYAAVPVTGAEHESVNSDNALGIVFRFLTGFPPRYFLRLDPV